MKRRYLPRCLRSVSFRAAQRRFDFFGAALLSIALGLSAVGCAKTPERPPESPLKQAKKDSRLDPQEEQDVERRHLAPPPAYGNKVVMAEGESPTSKF